LACNIVLRKWYYDRDCKAETLILVNRFAGLCGEIVSKPAGIVGGLKIKR